MNKHGGYYGEDYKEIIDFSVNINPLGPSRYIKKEMAKSLENVYRYPEIDGRTGIAALSRHMGIEEEKIILGNGAIELIYLFVRTLTPKKALIIGPTFNEYRRALEMNNVEVLEISRIEDGVFHIDKKSIIGTIEKEEPDVLILCNPNNPTGDYISTDDFSPIIDCMDNIDGHTLIDESFMDFTTEETFQRYINKHNIFILRSMTKFYSLPGIRLGYGLGNIGLIERLKTHKEPWTMNSIALDILPYVIEDKEFIRNTANWIDLERRYLYQELKDISFIKVFKPSANFLLFKLEKGNPNEFFNYLLANKIHIRTCEDFNELGDRYFRIAVKLHKDNMKIISLIRDWDKGGE